MKVKKWSQDHRDTYVYLRADRVWLRVRCQIARGMECTAPRTLPRGARFDYSVRATEDLVEDALAALEEYDTMQGGAQ